MKLLGHYTQRETTYYSVKERGQELFIKKKRGQYTVIEITERSYIYREKRNIELNSEELDLQALFIKEDAKVMEQYLLAILGAEYNREMMSPPLMSPASFLRQTEIRNEISGLSKRLGNIGIKKGGNLNY